MSKISALFEEAAPTCKRANRIPTFGLNRRRRKAAARSVAA